VQLPQNLAFAISAEVERVGPKILSQAATELSDAYRAQRPDGKRYIHADAHRLAYTTVRLPATYAAARSALGQIQSALSGQSLGSLLDLGAGPGTASWAALDAFPSLTRITLVEQDDGLIQLGKTFAQTAQVDLLESADWKCADLASETSVSEHDLIVCSYAIGELSAWSAERLIETAWDAARVALVIVEPGTVAGFNRIRIYRDQLISLGAKIIAPCPHANDCPMSGDDWCHFSQRLDRTSLHRQIKSGALGYEDEKFSYIAFSKAPQESLPSRVLRHPYRRSGHAHLELCTAEGLQQITVTRSAKADWKRVKKLSWGDAW